MRKKIEKLEIWNAEEVIYTLLRNHNTSALLNYSSALRGPDSNDEVLKTVTSGFLRGLPNIKWVNITNTEEILKPKKYCMLSDIIVGVGISPHFLSHVSLGFDSLKQYFIIRKDYGNLEEINKILNMDWVDIFYDKNQCKKYLEILRKWIDKLDI